MGAWGPGLYQDDVTCDVKEEYLNWLRVGKSNLEATQIVVSCNMETIKDEGPLFWFALAETQWKYGRLLPEVKSEALKHIEEGKDLSRWKDNNKQYLKRKKILEELKEKLNSPQPKEKKISKLKLDKALWNIGDMLLYQIQNKELKDNKWYGKYVLFKVVAITKTNIGSLPTEQYYNEQNVLALYNWVGEKDIDINKVQNFEFIKEANMHNQKKDLLMILSLYSGKKIEFAKKWEKSMYSYSLESNILNGVGIDWENKNTIDYSIIHALNQTEKDGILNDETLN